jgi:hypothetical protein
MYKILSITLFAIFATGCTTSGTINERVLDSASFDFSCPKKDIQVSEINSTSYGATGCSKKARYIAHDCSFMNYPWVCKAVSDGPIQK